MTRDRPGNPRRPPRSGGGRGLGPEDQALWDKVTRDATPLEPEQRKPAEETIREPAREARQAPVKTPRPAPVPTSRYLRPAGSGKAPSISIDLAAPDNWATDSWAPAPVGRPEAGLDRRNAERLRRGERDPDGRIDLHGMTADRAHRALDRRIGEALARGERLVLVITGKGGKNRNTDDAPFMREGEGVLRQQAPRWLRSGPHAAHLVGIYQAHLRHGGAGAFYVYLKKRR